jgi:hypothetical protein
MKRPPRRLLAPLAFLLSATALSAGNWANWRGPLHNGSSPEQGLPATFSKTENVKWSVDLPGSSAATPIIWGDRVFVTAADTKSGQQCALALDRRTGSSGAPTSAPSPPTASTATPAHRRR